MTKDYLGAKYLFVSISVSPDIFLTGGGIFEVVRHARELSARYLKYKGFVWHMRVNSDIYSTA